MFVIDGSFSLLIVSLLLWFQETEFRSSFKSLSSTLALWCTLATLAVLVTLCARYTFRIKEINQRITNFTKDQNLLRKLYSSFLDQDTVFINRNLQRIAGISQMPIDEQNLALPALTNGDKFLMHTYLSHVKYKKSIKHFFQVYIYLNSDLKFTEVSLSLLIQVDSYFNYEELV
jgi:hypothetical protein